MILECDRNVRQRVQLLLECGRNTTQRVLVFLESDKNTPCDLKELPLGARTETRSTDARGNVSHYVLDEPRRAKHTVHIPFFQVRFCCVVAS